MNCECVSWNAKQCIEIRYNIDPDLNDEECQCTCHDGELQ